MKLNSLGVFLFLALGLCVGPTAAEGSRHLEPRKTAQAGRAVPERGPAKPDHWFRQCAGLDADRGALTEEARPFGPASPTEPDFATNITTCADRKIAAAGRSIEACSAVRRGAIRSPCERALHEIATLSLGVCSGRLDGDMPVRDTVSRCKARTVDEAIEEIARFVAKGSCKRAVRCSKGVR